MLENLAKLARINLYLDQRGLSEEGVSTDTPVTIDLSEEISLKSALALILEPLHLSYVIKDEVLKITSEQMRDGEVYTVTYNVADLVIPIPNFVPSGRMGLAGALDDAHHSLGVGGGGGVGQRAAGRHGQQGRQPHQCHDRPQRTGAVQCAQSDGRHGRRNGRHGRPDDRHEPALRLWSRRHGRRRACPTSTA